MFDGSANTFAMTVVGGNDSNDGSDSLLTGSANDLVYGNGGNDTIDVGVGSNTAIGGAGDDSVYTQPGSGNDLVFLNEGNDTVNAYPGNDTIFAGQGNDSLYGGNGTENVLGNEGNDTLWMGDGIDTLSGGSGADVFKNLSGSDDGDNANGGGPVERITDVNFDEDRFQVNFAIAFAAQTNAGAAANLQAAADNALGAAWALAGMGAQRVAAQFDFNGRTYLAIDQGSTFGAFTDTFDLLFDVTGATGTIGASDFFV